MTNEKNGLIYTKPNCIGCNSCILGCPVTEANRSVKREGMNFLVVDPDKCIHCGHCIPACPHDSRDYQDDTESFLEALRAGKKISLVVSPAVMLRFADSCGRIINYLKSIGLGNVYDAGFGGTIVVWSILKFLDIHPEGGYALAECPAFVNYVEKYSIDGVQHLLPVQSSVMSIGIYARKYLGDENEFAYLGVCPARKDEFEAPQNAGIFSYNVTVSKLIAALDRRLYEDFPEKISIDCVYPNNSMFMNGGYKEILANFIGRDKAFLTIENARVHYKYTDELKKDMITGMNAPYITDVMNCAHGCLLGPEDDEDVMGYLHVWENYHEIYVRAFEGTNEMLAQNTGVQTWSSPEELRENLYGFLSYLNPDDFRRSFEDRFHQQYEIPEEVINEVFLHMNKITDKQRNVNCHSCGYESCREMARAIALGINRRENCLGYEKQENQRLYLTDLYTGIANMNRFNNRVTEIVMRNRFEMYSAACFAVIDTDLMYSRFGYDEVNKCFREYAQLADKYLQEGEILARNGDSEFMAIVARDRMDEFLLKMNRITVHPLLGQREVDYVINICAGAYQICEEDTVGDVIGKVSIALRTAKTRNMPCFIYYDDSMRETTLEAAYLTKALPDAIRNREFIVYYQPKVGLKNMKLRGAEALVRWIHAGEFISPGRFIPLFEKNGYVENIDFYVLDQVCRDLRMWLDAGMEPVRVSSNFSKLHISSNGLVNQIIATVDRYRIPHELVEIEFTETTAASERERLVNIIRELKSRGISTSIDDFGSGYSSLNMLQTMEFSVLKIDKGFLDAGIKDLKTRKIIGSIIRMAKDLEMEVVAEGVEKKEELEFLKENDCDMIQGYYFDKPLPAEDYCKRLENPVYEAGNS